MNRILYFIIIFLISISFLFSDEKKSEEQKKIDRIFETANNQFNETKYQQALEKFQEALKLSLKIKYNERDNNLIAVIKYDIGCCYYLLNDKKNAIKYLKDSIVLLDKYSNINNYLNGINELANIYWSIRDFKMYILLSEKMMSVYNKNNDNNGISVCYIDIGNAYYSLGDYPNALNNFEKALNISNEIKNENNLMYIYNSIANVYYGYGKYDSSLDNYNEAYKLSLKLKNNNLMLLNLLGQGNIYFAWGNYEQAHDYYDRAYNFLEKANDNNLNYYLSTVYDKIARIFQAKKNFDEAIKYFEKVLNLSREYNKIEEETQTLNSIGAAYFEWLQFDESINYFNQALELAEKNKMDFEKTRIYIHIGDYNEVKKNYTNAIYYYEKALKLAKSLNYLDSLEIALSNLGKLYYLLENYDNSLEYFIKAVDINEKIRKLAKDESKRDYLETQIKNYEYLTAIYLIKNNATESFNSNENSRAKYLAEKMKEKLKNINFKFNGIDNYRNKLNADSAIISFANSEYQSFIEFAIDKKKMNADIVNNDLINNLNLDLNQTITNNFENLRGLKIIKSEENNLAGGEKKDLNLTLIINYYRYLLSKPERTIKEGEYLKFLAQKLYDLLFSKISDSIKDKKTLIIIPDGILAYLPFETLIMPDGKYLIEKYDIKYVQSLTVQELIDKRKYSAKRKPLLAFGGAIYYQTQSNEQMVLNDKTDFNTILEKANEFLNRKKNLTQIYSNLGYKWNNLPGTLEEVNKISKVYKNSDIYTGESVNESNIKKLSEQNKLLDYKIIHFATHGLVDPVNPDLSALVLSQNDEKKEDGYLTLSEIIKLKLNADLVILSACETGLGKIYGGEGVVGLTQGFLLAGANALLVSLWQVADVSTMEFMTEFYKIISMENLTYNEAVNKMKRKFLTSEKYKDPFYWACFVYYGK